MAYTYSIPTSTNHDGDSNISTKKDLGGRNTLSKPGRQVLYGEDIYLNRAPYMSSPIVRFTNKEDLSLTDEILSKHLLLLGGIGCGKTNTFNFLIDQIGERMTSNDVMFIFDTKGDFEREFYHGGRNQFIIGNGEEYTRDTGHWNIFDEILMPDGSYKKSVCDINAREISKQLFSGHESESQPFFTDAAIDIFSKVLISFMRNAEHRDLNNKNLVSFLHGAKVNDYIRIMNHENDFKSALSYFGDGSSDQALGVFGTINAMVSELFVGIFAEKQTAYNDEFAMRKFVSNPGGKQIFVEYDLSVGEVLTPIYKVLFDQALKEALGRRTGDDEARHGNVYFIIDEFKLLPELIHIDDGLNFGRSLGVKICAGLQSISQLDQIYGEKRARVIASGFMNAFCFQTMDKPSRDYIKERFGINYVNYTYYDEYDKPDHFSREGNVVEDWDILNLKCGEAFVDINQCKPFKYLFPLY